MFEVVRSALTAAALASALTACFDGTVTVVVDVDDTSDIASYRLVIYEAPNKPAAGFDSPGELFNCRDLSFGDIPADVLDEALVLELDASPGEAVTLAEIPRKPDKLFFVEAFNAQGASIIAGCTDVGEISEPTTVVIDTLGRKSSSVTSGILDASGELGVVEAMVVGLDGVAALADIRASLRGAALGGATYFAGIEGTTGADGRISLDLSQAPDVDQLQYGPIEGKLRIAWAQSPATPISALLLPNAAVAPVVPNPDPRATARGNDLLEVGRVGVDGALNIVVLATDPPVVGRSQTNAHRFRLDGSGASAQLVPLGVVPVGVDDLTGVNTSARTLGIIHAAGFDKIIAVWTDTTQPLADQLRWTELVGGSDGEKKAPYSGIPNKLAPMNGCEALLDNALLAQVLSNRLTLEFAAPTGDVLVRETVMLPSMFDTSELIAVGCVRDTLGDLQTTLVIDRVGIGGEATTFAPVFGAIITNPNTGVESVYTGEASGALAASTTATTASIGSFSATGAGTIVLGEATGSGPATSRYLLQPIHADAEITVELQGSDPTPSVVVQTVEGDINGDGSSDIVSLVATGITLAGLEAAVHISMPLADSSERLRAKLAVPLELIGGRLRVVDIDGDGTDDIIVSSADTLRVYLMGRR